MIVNSPFWFKTSLRLIVFARQELLLFAGVGIIIGAIDEIIMDSLWLWLRLTGRAKTGRAPESLSQAPLLGKAAILVPAWQEAAVIGTTVSHTLGAWEQRDYTLYLGCYRNDLLTRAVALAAGAGDPRLRVVTVGVGIM